MTVGANILDSRVGKSAGIISLITQYIDPKSINLLVPASAFTTIGPYNSKLLLMAIQA